VCQALTATLNVCHFMRPEAVSVERPRAPASRESEQRRAPLTRTWQIWHARVKCGCHPPTAAKIPQVDAVETGRRLRAARAYSGRSRAEVAAALSVSVETLHRIERGERTLTDAERRAAAAVCGVPIEFFSMDFKTAAERQQPPDDLAARLEAVERELRRLGDES
jgi:transcriptional regulator with XRE-family HTH domain